MIRKAAMLTGAILFSANTAFAGVTDATVYLRAAASKFNMPFEFVMRVAHVETKAQCGRIGSSGERGPLQILPATANGLGYSKIKTASCARQTEAGMAHLAHCYKLAKGDKRATARCHNGGFGRVWSKNRAVNQYADKVMGTSSVKRKVRITAAADVVPAVKYNFTSADNL